MKKEESTKQETVLIKNVAELKEDPQPSDDDKKMQFAIALDATILGTNVGAYMKKEGNIEEILVLPKEVQADEYLTFGKLCDEIAKQFGITKETMGKYFKKIEEIFTGFKPDNIKFQLYQIFFYMKTTKKNTNEEKSEKEYAFSIKINLEGAGFSFAGIISIETLYLAIWNTGRKAVLDKLNMADLSKLLPSSADEKK